MIRRWNSSTRIRQGITATIAPAASRLGGGDWLRVVGKLWMPVMSRVMVTAFVLAQDHREQELVPGADQDQDGGGGDARRGGRDGDPEQRAQARAAVDPRGALER